MRIGPYELESPVILAPMAGVTDRPFRQLCRQHGAALTVSEMMAANPELRNTRKSKLRMDHNAGCGIHSVQIVGHDPRAMAEAARYNADQGAEIIDINMGCPAKKVCNKAAGSSLLRDEKLVQNILEAIVDAVSVPVTLKIRTGWCPDTRNALNIAHIAESAGIQALTIHGRTRACRFKGTAEYETIAAVKAQSRLPIIANGDIDSPEKAARVLQITGADAIMVGRAAQGQPWLLGQIRDHLQGRTYAKPPELPAVAQFLVGHVSELHEFYGELAGLRIARKHVGWTLSRLGNHESFRKRFNNTECAKQQLTLLQQLPEHITLTKKEIAA